MPILVWQVISIITATTMPRCASSSFLPRQQPFYQGQLAHVLLPLQESDGSWWDYILYDYHQQYGTAMAISSLVRCLPEDDR